MEQISQADQQKQMDNCWTYLSSIDFIIGRKIGIKWLKYDGEAFGCQSKIF